MNTICDVFYSLLYLAVNCSACSCLRSTWSDFSWRSFQECFRMLRSLVRQLIHVWRQSMRLLEEFLALLVFDTTPSSSCVCHPSVAGFGMVLADPVSSGKYPWIFVFTAPVAELNVVSFTVPLTGWTIAATATVVISCFSSADMCCGSVCVADVVWWWIFYSWWCLFCLGQCEADDWKIPHQLFPVPRGRWLCMHAEFLDQQQ